MPRPIETLSLQTNFFFFFLSPPEEATCIPAEIRGEDVEELVPVYQGVEDGAVGAIDHVALFGGPP